MPLTASLLADLSDPGAYPDRPRTVEVRETRRSWLFVAERSVYKLRKPWQIGRYDLSDYKARLDAADEELRLNRRLSPELYHGVVPIMRDELGRFSVQGEGEIVDWAIQRSWLPERATLRAQLVAGEDLGHFWDDLGRRLSQFHQRVSGGPAVSAYADAAILERADETRVKELRRFVRSPDVHGRVDLPLFTQAQWEELRRGHDEVYSDAAIFLRGRVERGAIRDGHGALFVEHLFAVEGRAWVIGAAVLEPTARFADGMRDVANLALDLELQGHAKAAESFLAAYRKHSGEQQFSVLLEFYRRERSLARALDAAERALVAEGDERARLAREATTLLVGTAASEHERGLVWVGGLPGSWDDEELARVAATQGATLIPVHRDADALTAARAELARGRGAMLAGGFWTEEDRRALRDVAAKAGVTLVPVLAEAKESECLDRLGAGGADISHKNLGVWMRAKRRFQPPEEFGSYLRWNSSDARRSLDAVLLEAPTRPVSDADAHADAQARCVLVVRPATTGSNPETLASNPFQRAAAIAPEAVLAEFDGLVHALDAAGVRVVVAADTPKPPKPDAVFPNNWVSFHPEAVVLYPMLSPSRRQEVRRELVDEVEAELGLRWPRRIDLTEEAERGRFLEGTGSLVLDRARRRGLVGRSPRNHPELVRLWGRRLDFELLEFDTRGPDGKPLYHTNVAVALGPRVAVWARPWVPEHEHEALEAWFESTGREALALDENESRSFAANALALVGRDDAPLWVLSERASRALRPALRRRLEAHAALVVVPLDAIETLGGGSARCTLAEVFPPRATESLLGAPPERPRRV